MKLVLPIISSFILLFFPPSPSSGQVNYASNVSSRLSASGKIMFIEYDILVEDLSSFFEVELIASLDGKRVIVNSAKGDIGSPITPGEGKQMLWEFQEDITGNINNVSIDVLAKIIPLPKASFKFEIISEKPYAPAEVKFENTSGNADMYSWDFGDKKSGDKNKSLEENPIHLFEEAGEYKVELSASSKIYKKFDLEDLVVIIPEPPKPPVAVFEIENVEENMEAPSTLVFINKSTNADEFSWDFGDPSSQSENQSSDENPRHTYLKAGDFVITLKSMNSESGIVNTFTKKITVKEAGIKPVANFEYGPDNIENAPITIWFKNTSVGANLFEWDFDDPDSGNSSFSKKKTPIHLFNKPGSYNVKLKATNRKSGKSDEKVITIVIPE